MCEIVTDNIPHSRLKRRSALRTDTAATAAAFGPGELADMHQPVIADAVRDFCAVSHIIASREAVLRERAR